MKPIEYLQTMKFIYQEIRQREQPWIALGNFLNDFLTIRTRNGKRSLLIQSTSQKKGHRWATFCAALVEYLCHRYGISCPSWVYDVHYCLSELWFDSLSTHKLLVRERLIHQTPEAFIRRNIYCRNRMFANKYAFAEQQPQVAARLVFNR